MPSTCASIFFYIWAGRELTAPQRVDDFPFDRNFAETRVIGNTVRTEGAFIRLGIGFVSTLFYLTS